MSDADILPLLAKELNSLTVSYSVSHKDLIQQWFKRSQGTVSGGFTVFDNFISLWFAFNSWGSYQTNTTDDAAMIRQLKQNPGLNRKFSELMSNDSHFKTDVNRLAVFEVLDMRFPWKPGKKITNVNDFGQVLRAIYQVRCNLFHGKKSIDEPHDKELVELSYRILTALFKPIVAAIH